jgi:hypothetical protein
MEGLALRRLCGRGSTDWLDRGVGIGADPGQIHLVAFNCPGKNELRDLPVQFRGDRKGDLVAINPGRRDRGAFIVPVHFPGEGFTLLAETELQILRVAILVCERAGPDAGDIRCGRRNSQEQPKYAR